MDKPGNTKLNRRVTSLEDGFSKFNVELRRLKEVLKIPDNWHSETKGWIGKEVKIITVANNTYEGRLKWVDKFQLAIVPTCGYFNRPIVLNKGAIEACTLIGGNSDGE